MSHATQTAALTGETWEGWDVEFRDIYNGDVIQLVRWTKHLNRITVRLTNDADYLVAIESSFGKPPLASGKFSREEDAAGAARMAAELIGKGWES